MADPKQDPPGRDAGWVVAAIVAVVAVCAVSFMITQRPQEAIAVAAGEPLAEQPLREPLPAHLATPGGAPEAIRVRPLGGAEGSRRLAQPAVAPLRGAMDANGAAADASATEAAH